MGLGLNARRIRNNFLKPFTITYSLRPIGDIGTVFRRYPGLWKVGQGQGVGVGANRRAAKQQVGDGVGPAWDGGPHGGARPGKHPCVLPHHHRQTSLAFIAFHVAQVFVEGENLPAWRTSMHPALTPHGKPSPPINYQVQILHNFLMSLPRCLWRRRTCPAATASSRSRHRGLKVRERAGWG